MRLGLSNSRVVFTPSTSMIADKEKKHYQINIFFENYNYAKFHHSLVSRNLSNATILTKLREYHQSPCLSISRNHSFIVSLINNPGGNRLGTSRVTVRSQVRRIFRASLRFGMFSTSHPDGFTLEERKARDVSKRPNNRCGIPTRG